MNHSEKMAAADKIFSECREILDAKGRDYSGTVDGMGNFRTHGTYGIIVRLHDKMSRLNQLTRPDAKAHVHDESIRDTLKDMINYAALALIMDYIESGDYARMIDYDASCKRAETSMALADRPMYGVQGCAGEF